MRTANIDHQKKVFHITVLDGSRVVALRSGDYREVIAYATDHGVPRQRVTLSAAAQDAAAAACFGAAR